MVRVLTLLILFGIQMVAFGEEGALAKNRPLVGAIRWDFWFSWAPAKNPSEKLLADKRWRNRLPFFTKIISDTTVEIQGDNQEVVDKEIEYAKSAGLDYWAFCYYHPQSLPWLADHHNRAKRFYLSSKHKKDINFCLLLLGGALGPKESLKPNVKEEWELSTTEFVNEFKEETYQKVAGGRPLVFIFYAERMDQYFGSWEGARKALDRLREKTQQAGFKNPYIAAMVLWGSESAPYVEALGVDALSSYSAVDGSLEHELYPYKTLAKMNVDFWETCKGTGKGVVPTVNAGWNGTPRLDDPKRASQYQGPYFELPKPDELARHLKTGMDWVQKNPTACEANAVIIYAWNEFDEGGWIVPTLEEGTARLDAIGRILKPTSKK